MPHGCEAIYKQLLGTELKRESTTSEMNLLSVGTHKSLIASRNW